MIEAYITMLIDSAFETLALVLALYFFRKTRIIYNKFSKENQKDPLQIIFEHRTSNGLVWDIKPPKILKSPESLFSKNNIPNILALYLIMFIINYVFYL